jgi:N,N'-diacetylchitobiose transport system permease protein
VSAHTEVQAVNPARAATQPTRVARRRRRPIAKYILNTVAVATALFWIFPIYWMLLVAVRPVTDIYSQHPSFSPFTNFTWINFSEVLHDPAFWQALRNSLIVVSAAVFIATFVGFLAAVALARFSFKFKRIMIVMIMIVQMVPLLAVMVPLYIIYTKVGLSESLQGLVVAYLALTLPFTIWTLRGFIAGVPQELEEAAMVDGCSRFKAFFHVILPLVVPGLISTAVFVLIQTWNEFQLTNFMINDQDHHTLALYLNFFLGGNKEIPYGEVMATAFLMSLPVVVLFMLVQRQIASGLTAGAVKG